MPREWRALHAGIKKLNALSEHEAEAELLKCCGSTAWARELALRRPFGDLDELVETADHIWRALSRDNWLEAFSRHPKIGEKAAAKPVPAQTRVWSEQEQAGTHAARDEVMAALAEGNRAYLARFGFIFIVCATGKSSEEMLALLRERLQNEPGEELRIAAEEQRKIMHLRLEKLLRQLSCG